MKTLLLFALALTLNGCALTFSTDGTKAGTRVSTSFQPTIEDFKALKELNR
jgi:uncharacterized protein YceK